MLELSNPDAAGQRSIDAEYQRNEIREITPRGALATMTGMKLSSVFFQLTKKGKERGSGQQ